MIKIRNRSTGVESLMTAAEWEATKNNALWHGVFEEVEPVKEPKEVQELQEKPTSKNATKK